MEFLQTGATVGGIITRNLLNLTYPSTKLPHKMSKYETIKHMARRAVTEEYKLIKGLDVEIENGLRIPLEDILEKEVRARCSDILGRELQASRRIRATRRKLQRSAFDFAASEYLR